jgi:hypothetical protein
MPRLQSTHARSVEEEKDEDLIDKKYFIFYNIYKKFVKCFFEMLK